MRKRRKMEKIVLMTLIITIVITFFGVTKQSNSTSITSILESSEYSYLSYSAKQYIEEIYNETGELILTEKNKQKNVPYLNPEYIYYIEHPEENFDVIPSSTIVDYIPVDIEKVLNSSSIDTEYEATYPRKYDLRNVSGNNYTTPVRNQGSLGLCWTFATAGSLESFLMKTTNTPYNAATSTLISERQIDYITAVNGLNNYNSEHVAFAERYLGNGGNFDISSFAFMSGASAFKYSNFKSYNDSDLSKMEIEDVLSYAKSEYELNGSYNIPSTGLRASTSVLTTEEQETRNNQITLIKALLTNYGAAYVGTYYQNSCMLTDSSGNTIIDVYSCGTLTDGHAMDIIGWDDDFTYAYCADTNVHNTNMSSCSNPVRGVGAWILKNSWGPYNTPYLYLTYDSLNSDINFITDVSRSSTRNWDNHYIYTKSLGNVGYSDYQFNLTGTKIQGTEKLKKIKFKTMNSQTSYIIEIKDASNITHRYTIASDLPGIVTYDFSGEDININSSSTIRISGVGGSYYIMRIGIFTSNIDATPKVTSSTLPDNVSISSSSIRYYATTKNIPSSSTITFKLYNSSNEDISSYLIPSYNHIATNNFSTVLNFNSRLANGSYRLEVKYGSNLLKTHTINYSGAPPDFVYRTSVYGVNESKNLVDGIRYNTGESEYINNFVLGSGYRMEVLLNGKPYIYTGSITKIYSGATIVHQFTNIVRGDINGDAAISALDYVMIKNHIMERNRISTEIELYAADVNNDNNISALDYVAIKNIIMGR